MELPVDPINSKNLTTRIFKEAVQHQSHSSDVALTTSRVNLSLPASNEQNSMQVSVDPSIASSLNNASQMVQLVFRGDMLECRGLKSCRIHFHILQTFLKDFIGIKITVTILCHRK